LPAKLNRPQIRAIWKMGMNLLSAVCRATGHKINIPIVQGDRQRSKLWTSLKEIQVILIWFCVCIS
jgi:hypothetical protein